MPSLAPARRRPKKISKLWTNRQDGKMRRDNGLAMRDGERGPEVWTIFRTPLFLFRRICDGQYAFVFARKLERPSRLHFCDLLATHHPIIHCTVPVPVTIPTITLATITNILQDSNAIASSCRPYPTLPFPPDIWSSDHRSISIQLDTLSTCLTTT